MVRNGMNAWARVTRIGIVLGAALLAPPFVLLALAPMLLMLTPVAIVALPFIVPALLSGAVQEVNRRPLTAAALRTVTS